MWNLTRRAALAAAAALSSGVFHAPLRAADLDTDVLSPGPLVGAVLENNQGIAALRAAVDAAAAKTELAGALADPMLSYLAAPNTAGGPGRGLNVNLQVSQMIPWPGTLSLRTDAAMAETQSSRYELDELRLRLAAETRAAYADWYYAQRALAINAENRMLVERLEKVAEAAYAAGQAPQQDVLQAQVELTRLENQTLVLERRKETVQAKINALLNRAADAPLAPAAGLPPAPALPESARLERLALERYPALQSLDARVAAAGDRVGLAEKARRPSFTLMAGYNSLMDAPPKRLVVGVGVNVPFGAKHRSEVDAADAKLRQSRAMLADARSRLLSRLDQTYATARQVGDTIRLYTEKLLPLAGQNLDAAEADYRNGSGDFLKLITAQQQDLMARLELERARADLFTQFASLDYQTGGALLAAAAAESTP